MHQIEFEMKSFLKSFFIIAICFLIWIILCPIFVIVILFILCLLFWRKFVDLCIVRQLHPDWIPVKPPDSMFAASLDLDPEANFAVANIGVLFQLATRMTDKEKTLHVLRESFKVNMMRTRKAFWKMTYVPRQAYGFYYWVPIPDFESKLPQYVHELRFETPPRTMDELYNYLMNHWISTNFGVWNSPWEIVVVETGEGERGIAMRLNHMVGGGLSFRWLKEALQGIAMEHSMAPFIPKNQKLLCIRNLWSGSHLTLDLLTLPWILFNMSMSSISGARDKYTLKKFCTDIVTARHVVSVDLVKRIARHFKIPFRTVLAATLGSALRKFELESCRQESQLPPTTQFFVALPWFYAQLNPMEPLNNQATGCFINYPIKCSNPVERLKMTHAQIQNSITNRLDRFIFYSRYISYVFPAWILRRMTLNPPSIPNSISDIPNGAESPIPLGDQFANHAFGMPGILGTKIGCMMTFISNGNLMAIGLTATQERIPTNVDAQKLCLYFQQELEYVENYIDSESELQQLIV